MKKYFLLFSLSLLFSTTALPSQDDFNNFDSEVFGDIDFNDPDILDVANQVSSTRAPATDVVPILIYPGAAFAQAGNFSILDLVKDNLFLRTHPLNDRSLHDLSAFLPQRYKCAYNSSTEIDLFWNQTSAMYFSPECSAIGSYLNIMQDKFDDIEIPIPLNGQEIKLSSLFPLFKPIEVQERRLGAMFIKEWRHKAVRFTAMLPFYYHERNYFVTTEEQKKIETVLGTADEEYTERLAKEHLVSDKLGIGDTRIYLDFEMIFGKRSVLNFGLLSTIPTAFAMPRGLYGSHFEPKKRPTWSFEDLFDRATVDPQGIFKDLTDFALGALDHLSANLLDVEMGYKHFGLGGFMKSELPLDVFIKRPWAESIRLKSRMSLEFLFPACEPRFFVASNKQEQLEALQLDGPNPQIIADRTANNAAYAEEVLAFLDKQMVDLFYPFVLGARVYPGVVFDWASGVYYEGPGWGFSLGSDLWVKGGERITNVEPLLDRPEVKLDICKATKPFAYQSKLFGTVFWKVNRPERDWIFSIHADDTFSSSGIGKDFTVTLCLEAKF